MQHERFDAIIVGSGFGGSVVAERLAEQGCRVCVLERGNAYPPHSFPRGPSQMRANFWNPEQGQYGLYQIWSFPGLGALVASGLGGGSLIYAGVLLRKEPASFVHEDLAHGGSEDWPMTYDDLLPHYERVERMLGAQPYPLTRAPYNGTAKTLAMQTAAEQLGLDWLLPNLAITFGNPGEAPVPGVPIREDHPNLHARTRSTCCLCGECNIGCNFGSKNSLDFTYLSAAGRHGAVILPRCEVQSFRPRDGGGFRVEFVDRRQTVDGIPRGPLPCRTITAERLILAAGTFGSTYLLLKHRAAFPALSQQLGTRFSSNGDLLTFLSQCRDDARYAATPRIVDGSGGPVITCTIRVKDAATGGQDRGFYLQDGGYPAFVSWVMETSHPPELIRRALRLLIWMIGRRIGLGRNRDLQADIAALFGSGDFAGSSLPLLAMGHDVPHGTLSLAADGRLALAWRAQDAAAYDRRVRDVAQEIAGVLHATLRENPLWFLRRTITAHPLGGCPMGRTEHDGVVNADGAVFNYPGLYVIDGSILPGPVGPNPSLTIAAIADRCAEQMLTTM